jgi:hypothetical protein
VRGRRERAPGAGRGFDRYGARVQPVVAGQRRALLGDVLRMAGGHLVEIAGDLLYLGDRAASSDPPTSERWTDED